MQLNQLIERRISLSKRNPLDRLEPTRHERICAAAAGSVAGKRTGARFEGCEMSADGGVLVLHGVERRLGGADRLARASSSGADISTSTTPSPSNGSSR